MSTASARFGRQERSRVTRTRILESATRLFQRDGYLETTMIAIASEAGVAVQTLYLAFGSKGSILAAAHDIAVAADADDVPVLDQPWILQVHAEPDARRALDVVLDHTLGIIERVNPIYAVIQSASADAEVAEILDRTRSQRFETLSALAAELVTKAGFATKVPADKAVDLLYAIVSDEQYRLLVLERGWSALEWRAWCGRVLAVEFFATDPT